MPHIAAEIKHRVSSVRPRRGASERVPGMVWCWKLYAIFIRAEINPCATAKTA